MGWSSKGFPLYLRSHKVPTTHKHSSRSGKGPLPASPNTLGDQPPHVKRWFGARVSASH